MAAHAGEIWVCGGGVIIDDETNQKKEGRKESIREGHTILPRRATVGGATRNAV